MTPETTVRTRLCLADHCGLTHDSALPIALDRCSFCDGSDLMTLWPDEIPPAAWVDRAVAIGRRERTVTSDE